MEKKEFNFIQDNINGIVSDVNKVERDFNFVTSEQGQQQLARVGESFGKNYIIKEAKTSILERNLIANYNNPVELEPDSGYVSGLFGLPIWDIVTLYNKIDNKIMDLNIALINVTQVKNIVKTNINGADGTIKEYINNDDYQINIKATLVGQGIDIYPADEIKNLLYFLKLNYSIRIESTILNKYFNLGYNFVITDYNIGQTEVGMRNVQTVEFNCLSDNPEKYKVIMKY